MRAPLHQTYEFYVTAGGGEPAFEAVTCPPDADVFEVARKMLRERGVTSIEVRQLGEHLFEVRQI